MDDLVNRTSVIKAINNMVKECDSIYATSALRNLEAIVKDLPSAQPETAKRIVGKSRDGMTLWYQCDMCNEPVDVQDNFCRGCGRRLTDE